MINLNYKILRILLGGVLTTASLGLAISARADTVLLDQIGSSFVSGSFIATSQFFEPAYSAYSIAAGDDFTAPASLLKITTVQAVVSGFNGFTSYNAITGWSVEIYSSVAQAGTNLVGNIASINLSPAQVTVQVSAGTTTQALVTLPVDFTLPGAGKYYFAVIPTNPYTTNGQTGITQSGTTTGGTDGFYANPGRGFITNSTQTINPPADLAYRVYATNAVPEPSTYVVLLGIASLGGLYLRHRRLAA